MAQYVHEFRALRLQLPTTEDEALDKFVRGLKFQTQRELLIRGPTTVDEAIQLTDRFDTAVSRTQPTHVFGGATQAVNAGAANEPQAMEVDNVRVGFGNGRPRLTPEER